MDNASERQTFRDFVGKVCRLDADKALSALAWQVFPSPIRVLLDNRYVFQPFWDALNNPSSDGSIPQHWRSRTQTGCCTRCSCACTRCATS